MQTNVPVPKSSATSDTTQPPLPVKSLNDPSASIIRMTSPAIVDLPIPPPLLVFALSQFHNVHFGDFEHVSREFIILLVLGFESCAKLQCCTYDYSYVRFVGGGGGSCGTEVGWGW